MPDDKTIRSIDALIDAGLVDKMEKKRLEQVSNEFATAITSDMANLMESDKDPIGKQFIPTSDELTHHAHERSDPIGDHVWTAVKGVVHRYPDRCLLQPVQVCAVYCRFCFRREQLGAGHAALTSEELDTACQYIADHPEIWEVILTGGDPLIMKPKSLQAVLERLNVIQSVEVVRLHSRIPIVDPKRINLSLIAALQQSNKTVYLVLHANHPKEFMSSAAKGAIKQLVEAGIPLLGQTVLLKGVNDNIDTLSQLMRQFVRHRIKPYYLHHGDLARGTAHFRVPIATGRALVKQLRGRFSGLCQPTYVIDIPGGYGKVPLTTDYITMTHAGCYSIEDYCGEHHNYNEAVD